MPADTITKENIVDYKHTLETLEKKNRQLELLARVTEKVNTVLEIPVIMRTLVASAMELVGAHGGTAGVVEQDKLIFSEYNRDGVITPFNKIFEKGYYVPGWMIETKMPYITNQPDEDPRILKDVIRELRVYNLIQVPVLNRDNELLGCLCLHNKKEHQGFDNYDIIIVQTLAANAATTLENARYIDERERADEKLKESFTLLNRTLDETVKALSSTAEKRDAYTAGHQRRVAQLSKAMAAALGYSEQEVHGIHIAASLHDIGKIYVPAEILNKPGRLTPLEMELIRVHPDVGREILKDIPFPLPIADIVGQHQERLDGTGYPKGLTANEILPETKIVSVADVIEAMTFHRPYKSVQGLEKALEEITRFRGIQFDPIAVDTCLSLFREKGFEFK